ncbi:MAG: caspase family protein [Actinomycetota bacterium]|nr:caspase family protein [Actinomycetota bacterium]
MSRRRAPAWQLEALTWLSAGILVAGVVAVFSVRPAAPAQAATPVTPVVHQTERVTTVRVPVKKTVKAPATSGRPKFVLSVPTDPGLGPPPGPQADQAPSQTAAPENRFAVLVGITHYRAPTHETIGGAADVRFIASALEQAGWLAGNIRVLADDAATGSAVRQAMAWLAAKSHPGTFSLFHYSGHVQQGGGREYLWPVDHDLIGNDETVAALHRVAGHVWVDIAGCESGGFMGDLPSANVLVTTSSRVTQKSYEYPDWGMSVWTGLLFDLGMTQGGADANNDGTVTIGEAIRYASYYAHRLTVYQTPYGPQIPESAGDPVLGWTLADPPA